MARLLRRALFCILYRRFSLNTQVTYGINLRTGRNGASRFQALPPECPTGLSSQATSFAVCTYAVFREGGRMPDSYLCATNDDDSFVVYY